MAFRVPRTLTRSRPPADQRQALLFCALFLLAVLPYVNTLMNNFVYDDSAQILDNPYVHTFHYLPQIFGTTVWSFQGAQGATNYYRPLMTFGFLLCFQIGRGVPFTFHLVNLQLHALVVWLIFCLLRRLSSERVALIAAGLFALHPIHTESVAWIAGVTDPELAAFYLLAFLLYLRFVDPRADKLWGVLMCASFVLALLSKEQAMTLPPLLTVFEHFYRDDRAHTTLRQKAWRYGPLWGIACVYMTFRAWLLGGIAGVVTRPGLSLSQVILSAIALIGGYLAKLVWPVHLLAFYVFRASTHLADPGVLLGLAGLAICAVLFAVLWRRAHIVSFGLIWMFATLAPVLNVRWMPASVFAERYLYLPSVGFCWIVAWAAVALASTEVGVAPSVAARAVPVVLIAIASLYSIRTVTRNRDWRTDDALYAGILKEQPDASLIRTNIATVPFARGDFATAEREWLRALADGPNNVFVLGDLGQLRARQHRYDEAVDYYWRALRLRPVYTMAHLDLAEAFAEMGRDAEADWQFRVATALSPLSASTHNSYGKFLFDAGRIDDARNEYLRSVRADPTADAYDQLGDIYARWEDRREAETAFRSAVAIDEFDSHGHFGLGKVLEAQGRPGDALNEIERGLETDPSDREANAALVRLRGSAPLPPAIHP